MTLLKAYSSPADNDRRSEFSEFYEATYPTIVGELLAITGGLEHARAVGAGSFSRAWQAWPAIRSLAEPETWVREDAMAHAYAPLRGVRLLERGLPPIEPVVLDPEDDVLVAALQQLPMELRLPLVLHYMAGIPTELIATWFRCPPLDIDEQLDDAFDTLVATLDWPVDVDGYVDGEEYDWTADVLQDSSRRLPHHITTPLPTASFRHAAAVKLAKRGAPVSVAAAACLGLVVALSLPNQQPTARPAAFTPAPEVDPFPGPAVAAPVAPFAADSTPPSATPSSPAPPRRPSLAGRATATMPLPVVPAAAAAPVVTLSTPPTAILPVGISTTPPASTSPTSAVTVTSAPVPPSTSTASSGSPTTEGTETETTPTQPPPRPGPTTSATTSTTATTASEETPPTEAETITEELPVTTAASDDD